MRVSIISAVLAISLVAMLSFQAYPVSTPHIWIDTPKYKEVLRLDMPKPQIQQMFNVMDSIMQTYGQDMMNSQSEMAKKICTGALIYLWNHIITDTVIVADRSIKKVATKKLK